MDMRANALSKQYNNLLVGMDGRLSDCYTMTFIEKPDRIEEICVRFKPHSNLPYIVKMRIELLCAEMFLDNKFG
jgi:hypothetical protein